MKANREIQPKMKQGKDNGIHLMKWAIVSLPMRAFLREVKIPQYCSVWARARTRMSQISISTTM